MEGKIMKILRKILMVMIMVAMIVTSSSFAAGDYSITVTVDKDLGEARGDISLWKVSNEQVPYDSKSSKLAELNKLSKEELNSKYSSPTVLGFKDNQILFDKLDIGAYYMRDTSGIKRDKEIIPALINLPNDIEDDSKNVTIHAKESSKNVRLIKVDASDNPLKGAEFVLIKIVNGKEILIKNKRSLDSKLNEVSDKESKKENSEKEKSEEKKDNKSENKEKSEVNHKIYDKKYLFVSNESGEIIVNDLEKGNYIFREVKAPEGYVIKQSDHPFTIDETSVELKIVNEKIDKDKGRHDFMKTDEAKNPLGGAMFKVVTKNKVGKFDSVKKNGKDYIVTSANNGKFSVEDLDYGKYYLVEIKAPKGFILLNEPVEFEIKKPADDKTISIVFITNKKGGIPKTGDIRFFMSIIGGAIMFFIGKWIIAKDDKLIRKDNK